MYIQEDTVLLNCLLPLSVSETLTYMEPYTIPAFRRLSHLGVWHRRPWQLDCITSASWPLGELWKSEHDVSNHMWRTAKNNPPKKKKKRKQQDKHIRISLKKHPKATPKYINKIANFKREEKDFTNLWQRDLGSAC